MYLFYKPLKLYANSSQLIVELHLPKSTTNWKCCDTEMHWIFPIYWTSWYAAEYWLFLLCGCRAVQELKLAITAQWHKEVSYCLSRAWEKFKIQNAVVSVYHFDTIKKSKPLYIEPCKAKDYLLGGWVS